MIILHAIRLHIFLLLPKFTNFLSSFKLVNKQILLRIQNKLLFRVIDVDSQNSMFEIDPCISPHPPEIVRIVGNNLMGIVFVYAK